MLHFAVAFLLCLLPALPGTDSPAPPAGSALPHIPGGAPPHIHGETLNDNPLDLPEAAAGKVTVLLIGFTRHAGQLADAWGRHLTQDFGANPNFTTYTVAVIQDAPALLRGMIRSGIRSDTPAAKREHVLTVVSGEAGWKAFLGVTDTSVPYLLLLDGVGKVRWSASGEFADDSYQALKKAVTDTAAQSKPAA